MGRLGKPPDWRLRRCLCLRNGDWTLRRYLACASEFYGSLAQAASQSDRAAAPDLSELGAISAEDVRPFLTINDFAQKGICAIGLFVIAPVLDHADRVFEQHGGSWRKSTRYAQAHRSGVARQNRRTHRALWRRSPNGEPSADRFMIRIAACRGTG